MIFFLKSWSQTPLVKLTFANVDACAQIFIVVNGRILNKELSHLVTLVDAILNSR